MHGLGVRALARCAEAGAGRCLRDPVVPSVEGVLGAHVRRVHDGVVAVRRVR